MIEAEELRLHHVGLATRDIAKLAPVYVERFGYRIVSPVIHDPLQTAFVQFLQIPGNPAMLEFVAPDGPESVLANAVKSGGGLNHLCYTSGPLEAEIERLRATGMVLISEPKPAVAFSGRRICWLMGRDKAAVELVERRDPHDDCWPGEATQPAR